MHIRKQRLLTPGPTPLYPPALHAMMASDIHHRTEDFRKVYRSCLADLKEVMGTSNDVLMFAASGTGAMDAAVSNLFSRGDKVIVCAAGKFGERWVEIAKAYGLDANVLTVALRRSGDSGSAGGSGAGRRTRHARASSCRPRKPPPARRTTCAAMGRGGRQDRRHLRGGRHHRPRHHAARHRRLGPRRGHRRFAEGLHDPARAWPSCPSARRPGSSPRPPRCRTTTST